MLGNFGLFDAYDTGTVQSAVNSAQAAFPDLRSALAYIRQNWDGFQALSSKIPALQHQAALAAVRAQALGRPDIQKQLQDSITYLGQLNVIQGKMFDEWDSLASGLSQLGLDLSGNPSGGTSGYYDPSTSAIPDSAFGQIPVTPWTLAAALTVAVLICGSIGYVSYRYSEQAASIATKQHALDLLAQGKLTPAETLQVIQGASVPASGGIFDSIRGTAGWLAVGALAVFVVPEIIKVFERRR